MVIYAYYLPQISIVVVYLSMVVMCTVIVVEYLDL